jgi:hypothetical protein
MAITDSNDGSNLHGDGKQKAICVLFGPQGLVTPESLPEIRGLLQANQQLQFLSEVVESLPALWPTILEAWPSLHSVPAEEALQQLAEFFAGGVLPEDSAFATNTLLSPLTVMLQIIEFSKLSCSFEDLPPSERRVQDVQGFCLGFLTATAVSCSSTEEQFRLLASNAIRLALCLGAVVDLDTVTKSHQVDSALAVAVRLKSDVQLQHLQRTMEIYEEVSGADYIPCRDSADNSNRRTSLA